MSSLVFDLAEVEAFLDSRQIKTNQQLAAKPDDPALLLASRLEPMRKMAIIELLRFINERPMTPGHQIASVYAFYLGASAGQVIGVLDSFGIRPPLIPELISVAMTFATKAAHQGSPDVTLFEMKPVS